MKEQQAIDISMNRVRKASRVVKAICDALSASIVVLWLIMAVFSIFGNFSESTSNPFEVNVGTFLYFSFILALVAAFLRVLSLIFSTVVKGDTPFCRKQVRRIRILAYLMVSKAMVEAVFSMGSSLIVQAYGLSFMVVDSNLMGDRVVYVDVGALCLAAVVICLSLVFEYGALLQRLSDDAA